MNNEAHEQLVKHLQAAGVLHAPVIIDAFAAIDRRKFVTPEMEAAAYADVALPLGHGQTISQPYTVAFMLELLQPARGQKILDIGSGSGWQTALLAHIVGTSGNVIALEIIPELCTMGRANVAKYSFIDKGTVDMHCQSGIPGYPDEAPYDRIIAAAAGIDVPSAWLAQTKNGGRIVGPIGSSILVLKKQSDNRWEREDYPGFVFVPLV